MAQASPLEQMVMELREYLPGARDMADRAYAAANASGASLGQKRQFEHVANRAADLIVALALLRA